MNAKQTSKLWRLFAGTLIIQVMILMPTKTLLAGVNEGINVEKNISIAVSKNNLICVFIINDTVTMISRVVLQHHLQFFNNNEFITHSLAKRL